MAVTFPTTTPEKINLVDDDVFLIADSEDWWNASKAKKSSVLSGTQATLVSGTNIKTINGTSVLGSWDITISSWWDLQDAYDASADGKITTDDTQGSVKIKRGTTWWDADTVFEIQDGTNQKNFSVTGQGFTNVYWLQDNSLTASELLATSSNKQLLSLPVATYPSLTELTYVRWVTSWIQNQLWSKIGTTLGAVWSSPNSNGATVTGTTLNLEPANLSNPWVVTAGAQTFGWVKSFANTFVDATWWANRASSLEIANTGNLSEFVITDAINLEVTDNFNHWTLAWVFFTATQSGNGDIDTLWGALGAANNDWTGTISLAIWAAWAVENSTTGAITEAVWVRGMVTETAGTITDAYAFKVEWVQGTNAYWFYNATAGSKNVLTETHILASDPLKFFDSDNSNYVAFKAPATVGTDVTWTLPNADGSASQVLTTNGSWVLSWSNPGGSWDVSKVWTPVDNQIWVWTWDGTIEWDANFTWDGTSLKLTDNKTILFGNDNDNAIKYDSSLDAMFIKVGITSNYIQLNNSDNSINIGASSWSTGLNLWFTDGITIWWWVDEDISLFNIDRSTTTKPSIFYDDSEDKIAFSNVWLSVADTYVPSSWVIKYLSDISTTINLSSAVSWNNNIGWIKSTTTITWDQNLTDTSGLGASGWFFQVTNNTTGGTVADSAAIVAANTPSAWTITQARGIIASVTGIGSGTTTDAIAGNFSVSNFGSNVFTNAYGIKVEDVTAGGTTNYAIKTGAWLVDLWDTTNIASASADYHQIAWGTGTITDTATGSSTDININLVPKGAGRLQAGGVNVPTISSTDTLTNKRITPRVWTTTSSATPTINTDNVDVYVITAQAEDITSFTTNLSGTPTSEQSLRIAITGTAARALARWASFEDGAVTLPTTTITTQRLDVQFVWNAATSKWRCMAAWPLS